MELTPNFEFAFSRTMGNEGGFILHKNEGDRGGWTFAGIAENFWPDWEGWALVKSGQEDDPIVTRLVKEFYKKNFWDKMRLDQVENKIVCYNLFDFGMNTGHKRAVRYAQQVLGLIADGIIGPKTIGALNSLDSLEKQEEFELKYAMAKIYRYTSIVKHNRTQGKFLYGWIRRTLKVLEE
ncbi:glycoside hydrolase family 108 protein [Ekhidna sp. To15]|uniref:glycoside hydrolase family 108 protein n=1 Tax=Ekhidna sp. To15 TaxID=3395267 RepID=UPI003F5265DC